MPAMPHMTKFLADQMLSATLTWVMLRSNPPVRMRARLPLPQALSLYDLFAALVSKMGIEFSRGNLRRPPNSRPALSYHRALHRAQRVDQSIDISHVYPTIPVGRQRAAGHKMNIRVLAAHKQYSFPRLDTGKNL